MVTSLQNIPQAPSHIYVDMTNIYFDKNHNFVVEILNVIYPKAQIHNCSTPSSGMYVVPDYTLRDFYSYKAKYHTGYRYLRNIFMQHLVNYPMINNYSKYIYISREDAKYRRVLNELELMEYLKPHGFQKITLTGIPLLEQMALFYNAEVIISIHGAALTNTLFCKPNTRIIELCSPYLATQQHFEDIAGCVGLNYSRYKKSIPVHNNEYGSTDFMRYDIIVQDIVSVYVNT
jgi:capsular polysaccharide biosynthesis protein